MTTTVYNVGMTCEGCSGAVTRILNKIEGVTKVECDIEGKIVTVTGTANEETMFEKLTNWGKAAGKEVSRKP